MFIELTNIVIILFVCIAVYSLVKIVKTMNHIRNELERYKELVAAYEPKVKQLTTMLGTSSGDSKRITKLTEEQKTARHEIAEGLRTHPMTLGLLKNVSDDGIIGALTDEQFIRGIGRAAGILGNAMGSFQGIMDKTKKEKGNQIGLAT